MSFKINPINYDLGAGQDGANPHPWEFPKIAGYEIECEIGRGGMATVYRAIQQSLNRQVAIKLLAPYSSDDIDFVQRLKKEGQILAQLLHPNIITIYDVGVSENNQVFLSIEYLSGGTLKDKINQGLSFENSVEITRSIAKALGYAHQKGVIHRDIKPSNIMFRHDGTPVLTDFGIARLKESNTLHTLTGLIIGSPGYMSPEQAMGESATVQSDLYGLGIVLYEMLTGSPPYKADNPLAILLKHINNPVPELPKEYASIQPVLNRLLSKKISDRYKDAGEFLNAFSSVTCIGKFSLSQKNLKFFNSIKIFTAILLVIIATVCIFYLKPEYLTGNVEIRNSTESLENMPNKEIMTLPVVKHEIDQQNNELKIKEIEQEEQQRQNKLHAEYLLVQAQNSLEEGLLQTALVYAEQGLLVIPDHENLIKLRELVKARVIEQQRHEEEARRKAEIAERQKVEQAEAIRKRQEAADQYLIRASRHQENGKYADSLQQIDKGLAIIPNHEGLLRLKKEVHAKQADQRLSATKTAKEKSQVQNRQSPVKTTAPPPVEKDAELKKLQDIKKAIDALNDSLDK